MTHGDDQHLATSGPAAPGLADPARPAGAAPAAPGTSWLARDQNPLTRLG
jgi:hypothetical protein